MFTQSYLSPSIVIMISLINIESRSFRGGRTTCVHPPNLSFRLLYLLFVFASKWCLFLLTLYE